MGKKKKLRTMIITFCASMVIFSQFVYAYTYSDYGTFDLTSNWKETTSTGGKLKDLKESNSTNVKVYANAMTMYTNPNFKLVNNEGTIRSSQVNITTTNITFTGGNNTGTSGYNYYASVKPSLLQAGTDSIRLTFSAE